MQLAWEVVKAINCHEKNAVYPMGLTDKLRILIIEDEAIIAEDIRDMLTALGYQVDGIINHGDKAIDYLSFHTPDLVLCDIHIKGSQDGISVAESIRAKKKIPFIYLTSLSDRQTLERAKRTLPYGYIVKPFDERDLVSAIEVAWFKFTQDMQALALNRTKLNALASSALTDQEYLIIMAMVQGKDYDEICTALEISNNTLKYHIKNILTKMDAENRAEVMQKIIAKYLPPG